MNLAGFEPWIANATSSTVSITVVYLVATRQSFQVGTGWRTYLAFFGWYALSIASFSALIQFLAEATSLHTFLLKLMTVPVSFCLNYSFSKILFGRKNPTASKTD